MFSRKSFWFINITTLFLLLFFQNCGQVKFDRNNQEGPEGGPRCDIAAFTGNLIINSTTFNVSPSEFEAQIPENIRLSDYTIEIDFGDGSPVIGPIAATNYRNINHTYTAPADTLTEYTATVTLRSNAPNNSACEKIFTINIAFDLRLNPACLATLSGPATGTVGVSTNNFQVQIADQCPDSTTTTRWDQDSNGTPGATGWERTTVNDLIEQFIYTKAGRYRVVTATQFNGSNTNLVSNSVQIDIFCPSPISLPNADNDCVCHSNGQITTNGQCEPCGSGSTGLDPSLGCQCPAGQVYSQQRQRCECPSTQQPPNIGNPPRCPVNCGTLNLANNRTLQLNDGATANIARVSPSAACGTACSQNQIRCDAGIYRLNDASNTVINNTNSTSIYLATDINICTNNNLCAPSECGTARGRAIKVIPTQVVPELCAANNILSSEVSPTNPTNDTQLSWQCRRDTSTPATCNARFCGSNQIIVNNGTSCQTCPTGTQPGTGAEENQCVPIRCPQLTIADGTVQLNYNQQIPVTHDNPTSPSCLSGTLTCEVNGTNTIYVLASNNESIVVNNSTLAMQIYRNTPPASACTPPPTACFQTSPTQDGSAARPWVINSCSCLQAMQTAPGNSNLSHNFRLGQNIDCTESASYNSGEGFTPISLFFGQFEGNNFTISNLTSRRQNANFMLLAGGTVQNVNFANVRLENPFQTGNTVSLFDGTDMNHTLRNIRINGANIRGVNTATLYGNRNFRGLAERITAQNITLTSSIQANTRNDQSTPHNSTMAGLILGLDEGPTNKGRILDSSFQGTITGGDFVGGIVDTNYGGEIRNTNSNLNYTGTGTRLYVVAENTHKSFMFVGGISRLTLGGILSNVRSTGTANINIPASTQVISTYFGGITQQVDSTTYNGQLRTGVIENSFSDMNFIARSPNPLPADFSSAGGGLTGTCYISYSSIHNNPSARPRIINSRATGSISYFGFRNDGLNSVFGNFIPWRTSASQPLSQYCNIDSLSNGTGQVTQLPN